MALAGRTAGNLATEIQNHPAINQMPNDGFCGWQFSYLLENGKAVCFETDVVPFDPVVEVVSTYKFIIRQAALFEFRVGNGGLLVCSLRFSDSDPAAQWLRNHLITYAASTAFDPAHEICLAQLTELAQCEVTEIAQNKNLAFNINDKAAVRK